MKSKGIKKFSMFFALTFVMTTLVGCAQTTYKPEFSDGLVINLSGGDWGYPSPYTHYSRGPGMFKMRLIFDSLLERGEEGLIPWLAKDYDISNDGKVYTFVLNQGVKWHDGKDLTAEDVKFSFEYFIEHTPVVDDLTIGDETFIESIDVVDDYTIKITVKCPNATILSRLGATRIIPKHIWEGIDDPKKFTEKEATVGCGPYILKEYNKEQGAYRFEAFEEYWGPKPKVDSIQFIPVSDNILAFNKGEIDITGITADLLSKYEGDDEYAIMQNPAFWGYKLMFNMDRREELKDKNIRYAIAHSIDVQELIDKVARGAAVPGSSGYLPVDHIWYNQNVRRYDYNIDRARELLKGKDLELNLVISNSEEELRIGELLKISLAKSGIELDVKSVDMKTRDAMVKSGDYELALIGHGGWGGDPDMLRRTYATGAIPGYSNEEIDKLADLQLMELDEDKRREVVFELQERIGGELPLIPLYNTTGYIVYRPGKYNGWMYMFDHHEVTHSKLSYLEER